MRRSALIAALTAAVLLVPLGVFASHQFDDVPDSHLFHNAIGWLADNDVTKGCNPPTNDQFCPDDNVTRGQMAAFMKRMSEGQIVDAGALGGADPSAYQGRAGAVVVEEEPFPIFTETVLGEMNDFEVPTDGGVLVATGITTAISDAIDDGALWLEIDGSGLCDGPEPPTFALWEAAAGPFNPVSTSRTASVSAGLHDVQLCAVSLTSGTTGFLGSLNVQWVEQGEGSTTSGASSGPSLSDYLENRPDFSN